MKSTSFCVFPSAFFDSTTLFEHLIRFFVLSCCQRLIYVWTYRRVEPLSALPVLSLPASVASLPVFLLFLLSSIFLFLIDYRINRLDYQILINSPRSATSSILLFICYRDPSSASHPPPPGSEVRSLNQFSLQNQPLSHRSVLLRLRSDRILPPSSPFPSL